MQKHLFSISVALLLSAGASAQCTAGFTWSQSQPNVIDFVNTSTPQNPGSQYWWAFGDTLSGYGAGPIQHTYFVPGVYYVCLSMFDSVAQTNCATFCDSVTVTGSVLCNMTLNIIPGLATCPTCADGNALTNITGGTAPYTYAWSTGATTPTISNLLPGAYSCCVTDMAGCVSCDTVNVPSYNSTSCSLWAQLTFPAPDWIHAEAFYNGVSSSITIAWDFGDLTTATGNDVWHQYAQSGTYAVCATLTDALTSCTTTFCDTISITVPSACNADFFVQPDPVNPNQTWIYNLSSTSPTTTYQWDWGDNTTPGTGFNPSHIYQNSGTYWIFLFVTDAATQCVDTAYSTLFVARYAQETSVAPHYVNVVPPPGTTGINSVESPQMWSLYPNPANSVLTITGSFTGRDQYIITDLTGRTAATGTLGFSTIDVGGFAAGTFVFTVMKENGEVESKRFVRE